MRHSVATLLCLFTVRSTLVPNTVQAQSKLRVAASGRAATEVALAEPRLEGQAGPPASKIRIDYGVPFARGRSVHGALDTDLGSVWRLGANEATSLVTDVDIVIGNATIPKGSYTLFVRTAKSGSWTLIVNRKTGEWGTDYDAASDLAKIELETARLQVPLENLNIWLVPSPDGLPKGTLRIGWGDMAFSTTWSVKP